MEKDNFIRNLYPSTKAMLALSIILSSIIITGFISGYLMYFICLIICLMAGSAKEFLSLTLKTIIPISIFIFLIQGFLVPGDTVLWEWNFLALTKEGIIYSLQLTSFIIAIGSSIMLLFIITPIKDVVYGLESAGVSPMVSYVVLLSIKIVPDMKNTLTTILDAQKTRGVETEGNIFVRVKAVLPTLMPLTLSWLTNTEHRSYALEARGFTLKTKKTNIYSLTKTKTDQIIILILILILIILLIWRVYYEMF